MLRYYTYPGHLDWPVAGAGDSVSMSARWTIARLIEDFEGAAAADEPLQLRWSRGKLSSCAVLLAAEAGSFAVAMPADVARSLVSGIAAVMAEAGILAVEERSARLVGDDGNPAAEEEAAISVLRFDPAALRDFVEWKELCPGPAARLPLFGMRSAAIRPAVYGRGAFGGAARGAPEPRPNQAGPYLGASARPPPPRRPAVGVDREAQREFEELRRALRSSEDALPLARGGGEGAPAPISRAGGGGSLDPQLFSEGRRLALEDEDIRRLLAAAGHPP